MTSPLNEAAVEQASIDWMKGLGWQYAYGPDIGPDGATPERESYGQVVLEQRLRDALAKINPALPAPALQDAFRRVTRPKGAALEQHNRAFPKMLFEGVNVKYPAGGGAMRGANVKIIDFDNPSLNDWLAVNQFTVVEHNNERRPDIAPDVELYISNPQTPADLNQTALWMITQGVDIINHSVLWVWDGPCDGTSPTTNRLLHAVDGGILWVSAAGNNGDTSWLGSPKGQNDNRWMEFGGQEKNQTTLSGRNNVTIHLRWDDDWPGASRDLDLYPYDSAGNLLKAATSAQTGRSGHKPRETLSYSISRPGIYSIKVKLNDGTLPDWVQITVWSAPGSLSINTGGSIANPADSANPWMLAVSAASWANSYSTGQVTAPTNAGGLVGTSRGRAYQSYWATETSGQDTSAAGTGQTTAELQAPANYTRIYENWNQDNQDSWDFRTANDYPALKTDFDQNGIATWSELGNQQGDTTMEHRSGRERKHLYQTVSTFRSETAKPR